MRFFPDMVEVIPLDLHERNCSIGALGQTRVKWWHWVGLPSKSRFSLWSRVKLSLRTYQAHCHYTLIICWSDAVCAKLSKVQTGKFFITVVFVQYRENKLWLLKVCLHVTCILFFLYARLSLHVSSYVTSSQRLVYRFEDEFVQL